MLNIIGAIFSGLIIGVLARWFYPGEVPMSGLGTILLGIGGALLAGLITSWRTADSVGNGFNRAGCLASLIGALVLIFVGRQLGWG
jgi:uncharacterized membrane protein YeaQ/YmgE (transglycosylase-associated protein family)